MLRSQCKLFICLTVIFLAGGATAKPVENWSSGPLPSIPEEEKSQNVPLLDSQNLDLIKKISVKKEAVVRFRHPGVFAFEFGPVFRLESDVSQGDDVDRIDWLMGLQFRKASNTIGHWEGGLDIFGDELGGFHLGYRIILDYDRKVRPQFKVALASKISKGDRFADLLTLEKVGAKGSIAVENLHQKTNRSFRLELEGFAGIKSIHGNIKFGWTWDI